MIPTFTQEHNIENIFEEIAFEWDSNLASRACELESKLDATYWQVTIPTILELVQMMKDPKLPSKSLKILDAGCGLGYLTNKLAENGYQTVGIDLSARSIKYGKKKFPNINFVNESIERHSDVYKSEYDICILNMVLHNTPDLNSALIALKSVLKDEGMCIILIPHPDNWISSRPYYEDIKNDLIADKVIKIPFKIRSGSVHPSNFSYFHRPIEMYLNALENHGFYIFEDYSPATDDNEMVKDLLFIYAQKETILNKSISQDDVLDLNKNCILV